MSRERSPGMKLVLAGFMAVALAIPLMMVYALVWDRENQSEHAQSQITQGWGGAQTVTGPILVIPYVDEVVETTTIDGEARETRRDVRRELFVSPMAQSVETSIDSDRKGYAIYESVVFEADMAGTARFVLTEELEQLDIAPEDLRLEQAELRFGVSDPRGLRDSAEVTVDGTAASLRPGNGPLATGGAGFSSAVAWSGEGPLQVAWRYGLRGSRSLSFIPRGGATEWHVSSPWPHPGFTGSFLPNEREITANGFAATYSGITNLALNRGIMTLVDEPSPYARPVDHTEPEYRESANAQRPVSAVATIGLTDPVDLYSQVDRAVKYGFLFIGFTFAMFLMFDLVGGARVAAAEYLLSGAGLVLFFVMLLAFAEVVGFAWAYVFAAAAVVGLLTAYSAAILGTWKRAGFVGGMLAGLYTLLLVLLNMETYSLLIGSVLLFLALAAIMFATRRIDWSGSADEEAIAG